MEGVWSATSFLFYPLERVECHFGLPGAPHATLEYFRPRTLDRGRLAVSAVLARLGRALGLAVWRPISATAPDHLTRRCQLQMYSGRFLNGASEVFRLGAVGVP